MMQRLYALGVGAGVALALGCGPAAAYDFDDEEAQPLHFAAETLSADAVTVTNLGTGRATYYNLEAPPDGAELTTTSKFQLSGSAHWFVRVDLDGMVFSATPKLAARGEGSGTGYTSPDRAAFAGGAGEAFVIHRLPADGFARGLTFALSIGDTLAVPVGEAAYRATMALYDGITEALDAEDPLSYRTFGGEATVVRVVSGIEVGIASGFAVADAEEDFRAFVEESPSGASTDPNNPSAPAVLGSIAVNPRGTDGATRGPPVYAARGGSPVTAAQVIESVSVTIEGDMTFATFDFRTGTAGDRCLATSPPSGTFPGGGVIPLVPPLGDEAVTVLGTATLEHDDDDPWSTRHLCVWLTEPERGARPPRIPIAFYEATVRVTPPFGPTAEHAGNVGVIGRSGAQVNVAHLTAAAGYDELLVMVNRGFAPVRYVIDTFLPPAGVTVALTPEAEAAADSGLNMIEPGQTLALSVAETLSVDGTAGAPAIAATLWFNANADHIDVALVRTNRADGSTDTVVHRVAPAVRPEDYR